MYTFTTTHFSRFYWLRSSRVIWSRPVKSLTNLRNLSKSCQEKLFDALTTVIIHPFVVSFKSTDYVTLEFYLRLRLISWTERIVLYIIFCNCSWFILGVNVVNQWNEILFWHSLKTKQEVQNCFLNEMHLPSLWHEA